MAAHQSMHRHRHRHRHLLLPLLLLLPLSALAAGGAPAIIVFGDSTVDAGNNNHVPTFLRSDFPPYGRDFMGGTPTGRFCNGRLPTDFIAEALGLGPTVPAYLDPAYGIQDFATGVCFASAGTGLDNATSGVLSVMPLWKEVELFKDYLGRLRGYVGREEAERIANEAAYIVSVGTNDFLANYYSLVTDRSRRFTVGQFEDLLVGLSADFVTDIYRLGARKISFTSLTPIGCLPLERTANVMGTGACVEEHNKVARDFNEKLKAMVEGLSAALPGLRLRLTDVYDPVLNLISNPSLYGFENVAEGCCATGRYEIGYLCNQWSPFTCPDADKYFFWDSFHPTEKVNRILAEFTLNGTLAEIL